MNADAERKSFTWPGGPAFRLTRTTLGMKLSPRAEERAVRSVPPWARHPWLVERLWLRWLYGPHFLDQVDLRFDGSVLTYLPPNGRKLSWGVPPDHRTAALRFTDEVARRRERREVHRVEHGKGRSALPLLAILGVVFWLLRRTRSS